MKTFEIQINCEALQYVKDAVSKRLIRRGLQEGPDGFCLLLVLDEAQTADAYRITGGERNITITAGKPLNVLAGCGTLLRGSRFDESGIILSSKRGLTMPDCSMRGAYFANHFHNYYHMATTEELEEYLLDLGLWGFNALRAILPVINLQSRGSEETLHEVDRLAKMLGAAQKIGMPVCVTMSTCITYADFPKELISTPVVDLMGRQGNAGKKVCISKPGAQEWIDADNRFLLSELKKRGITLDMVSSFPYDEGGCGCEKCAPWGANGYVRAAKHAFELAKEYNPKSKSVLCTWTFDKPEQGEWKGLSKALADEQWCDYIMADDHEEYPRYPLEHGVPGNLPLISFPEISMWGLQPWGGFGTVAFPWHVTDIWHQTEGKLQGGFLYSEGIFEDINKVAIAGLYEDYNRTPEETLRQYAAYEIGCRKPEQFVELIRMIEKNHVACEPERVPMLRRAGRCTLADVEIARQAHELARKMDAELPDWGKQSWRWRIVYIRTLLDLYRYQDIDLSSREDTLEAMHELIDIYKCLKKDYAFDPHHQAVRPPCPEYED